MRQKKAYQVLQDRADSRINKLEQESDEQIRKILMWNAVYHDALEAVCIEHGVNLQEVLSRAAEKRGLKAQLSDGLGSLGKLFDKWFRNKNIYTNSQKNKNEVSLIKPNRILKQIMFNIMDLIKTEEEIGFHRGARAKRRINKREISEQNRQNRLGKRNITTSARREAARKFLQSLIESQGLQFVLTQSFSSLGQSLREIYPSKIGEADHRNYANSIKYALNQIVI
ncbi:hypothetical protein [Shewanella gaetbuli]